MRRPGADVRAVADFFLYSVFKEPALSRRDLRLYVDPPGLSTPGGIRSPSTLRHPSRAGRQPRRRPPAEHGTTDMGSSWRTSQNCCLKEPAQLSAGRRENSTRLEPVPGPTACRGACLRAASCSSPPSRFRPRRQLLLAGRAANLQRRAPLVNSRAGSVRPPGPPKLLLREPPGDCRSRHPTREEGVYGGVTRMSIGVLPRLPRLAPSAAAGAPPARPPSPGRPGRRCRQAGERSQAAVARMFRNAVV
jgi:hypothetical protein